MKPTVRIITLALAFAFSATAPAVFAAEKKKDEHAHEHHGLPESKIAVPGDAAGIWKAIAEQQKTLADQLSASQFDKTDDTVGALGKLINALPDKAPADKAKKAKAQAKAAVNVLEDLHHAADDKEKGKAEQKATLLDSALKALKESVPAA